MTSLDYNTDKEQPYLLPQKSLKGPRLLPTNAIHKGISFMNKKPNAMQKKELIALIAKASNLSKSESKHALEGTIQSIIAGLKEGKNITLPGLGVFNITQRNARKCRNPRTGESMQLPASQYPKFRLSQKLRDTIK
jgi:DNA-binding protein HU-beta